MSDIHVRQQQNMLWLILDRPPLNRLTVGMLDQLSTVLRAASKQPQRLIVFTGMGEWAFSDGAELPASDAADLAVRRAEFCHAASELTTIIEAGRSQGIATVALVKGAAYGAGCELVALCDTVIAREDATFRLPEANAQIFPAALSVYLPASIEQEIITQFQQEGTTLTAQEAARLGLVHQVLSARRFLQDTQELLTMLARLP